jgi:hypothetical protein
MANSSTYLVQTRNRCIVSVYGDTTGTISFGITAPAFNNGFTGTNVDPRINTSSASLSKIVYGLSGQPAIIGFGSTSQTAGSTGVAFVLPVGTNQLDFERFTIPNGVTNSPNGTFYVTIPASTTVTAYLEFVPF